MTAKADEVAAQILSAFEAGDLPKALANVYLDLGKSDGPSSRWSWSNRLLMAMAGHRDARTFRQWKEVGRSVMKGQKACHILAPLLYAAKEADPVRGIEEGDPVVRGFKAVAVFGYCQTQGEALPWLEEEAAFLDSLPLNEVARAWNLKLSTFAAAEEAGALGLYYPGTRISLAVSNLATWAHELVHAADDRLGSLTKARGQNLDNEVVAEFGGAILLEALGKTVESDRGGAYRYIWGYAANEKRDVLSVCNEFLGRTCAAVELILSTSAELAAEDQQDAEEPLRAAG